jgi:predicted nucleotidyltransferase
MRLSPRDTRLIGETVRVALGDAARVRLFGSRVDDASRGGDIDLLVEVDHTLANRAAAASRLAAALQLRLGDQRIDVILVDPTTRPQPIHDVARQQGISL